MLFFQALIFFGAEIAGASVKRLKQAMQGTVTHGVEIRLIRNEYVEEPNFNAVRDGALHGLLESLDASSSYLSPEEYKRLKEQHPDKAGIGATVSKRFGFAAIVSVVPGSPADKNGLVTGDIIESVEGQSTREISLAAVRNL